MARQQVRASDSFEKVDPVWNRIRREAEEAVRRLGDGPDVSP